MSILDKWLGRSVTPANVQTIEAHFGRFTDANKTPDQYDAWDKSMILFEKRDYAAAIHEFIRYIQDPRKENVIRTADNSSEFSILQGSKTIEVKVKNGQISFSCKVAHANQLHIGFMRRLLDLNYELKYVRYGLSEDHIITLLFDTALEDASPYKLYFALKELSIHADKQDDLLVGEFDFLKPVHSGHVESLPLFEQEHKLLFFKTSIQRTLEILEKGDLKIEQYPAATGYMLLALLYKLDYLVRPEGALMDKLEQVHKIYFSQDNKNLLHKLKSVRQEFSKLSLLSDQDIKKDLFASTFTFGITSPANTATIQEALDRELSSIQWYLENQYDEYAEAILEYAAGLCLFNYSLPLPIKDLLTIIYRVTEPAFFTPFVGFVPLVDAQGLPDKSSIKKELTRIEKMYQKDFPQLIFDFKSLQFDKVSVFLLSFCKMMHQLPIHRTK